MVTFPEEIHPKHGLRLRFNYKIRAFQFLDHFKIILMHPLYKFVPLDLTFVSYEALVQFLYSKGIVSDEIAVSEFTGQLSEVSTIVDTRKIYEVEESLSKYMLNYKYYSINEVAEMLSFSRTTVYKLVNDNTIKSVRVHGQVRVNHLDLMAFINKEEK